MISETKVQMLISLMKDKKITVDDIKDSSYQNAVKDYMKVEENK